jgi:hypothetical protein
LEFIFGQSNVIVFTGYRAGRAGLYTSSSLTTPLRPWLRQEPHVFNSLAEPRQQRSRFKDLPERTTLKLTNLATPNLSSGVGAEACLARARSSETFSHRLFQETSIVMLPVRNPTFEQGGANRRPFRQGAAGQG